MDLVSGTPCLHGTQIYDIHIAIVHVFAFDQDLTFHAAAIDQIVHAVQASQKRGLSAAGRARISAVIAFFSIFMFRSISACFHHRTDSDGLPQNNVLHYATS